MDTVPERITALLVEHVGVEPADVRFTARFEEMGMDSLAVIELAEILQEEFHVQIPDEDFARSSNLADLVALLRGAGAAL
jgi:acyl carrier protein